jgi:hypothetical protein
VNGEVALGANGEGALGANGEGALGANGEGALGANGERALGTNKEGALKVGSGALAGASMHVVRACRMGQLFAHCLMGARIHWQAQFCPHHLSPPQPSHLPPVHHSSCPLYVLMMASSFAC